MNNLAYILPEDTINDNSSVIMDFDTNVFFPKKLYKGEVHWIDDYRKLNWPDEVEVIKYIDDLSDNSKDILGENGVKRFNEFLSYEKGWDFGRGEPLSKNSVAILDSFLNLFEDIKGKEPSLFLTRSGNLQLSWEDDSVNTTEIEFFPDKIEYLIESDNEEGEIYLKDHIVLNMEKFIERLAS